MVSGGGGFEGGCVMDIRLVCSFAVFWGGRAGADAGCGKSYIFCDAADYSGRRRRDRLYDLWADTECGGEVTVLVKAGAFTV